MMQRMMTQWMSMILGSTFVLVLGAALLAGVASAEMYSWRTEDGAYAYTDDREHIPARYAAKAKRVKARSLGDYSRFTPQDDKATDHYAAKLSERLQYLRQVNAPEALPAVGAAPPGYAAPSRSLSFSTGGVNSPEITVPIADDSQGPVIVEPINAKQTGDFRTRRVSVIRQGGRTIAVIKGNPHHHNPSTDIYDEDDLDQGLWDE